MRASKTVVQSGLFVFLLWTLGGCGGGSSSSAVSAAPPALSAKNLNLIFVVSEDLAFNGAGDIDLLTANLTNQGFQRSLRMATFLRRRLLGGKNVTAVYAVEPMTHLQTASGYPDIVAVETIQEFALQNQVTLTADSTTYTANSFPVNVSYAPAAIPSGVATPAVPCLNCQGIDFADQGGDNETLVNGIISANVPGFYVFSAPWEIVSALLASINSGKGNNLAVPTTYAGPNIIYAITITPSGTAHLLSFNSNVNPQSTYPALPEPGAMSTPCTAQAHFTISVTAASMGVSIPPTINKSETVYLIRHAEAHPILSFEDGNYVCAGQWRALELPNFLPDGLGMMPTPQQVYSIDPAQVAPGGTNAAGDSAWSYVRPSLTAEPYAIANGLPFGLAANFELLAMDSPLLTSNFFFTGGQFSNQVLLVAYEHDHIPPTVNALLGSYFPGGGGPVPAPGWPDDDYDTIWTVTLDANGNLSVDNSMCEGIASATLPVTCPEF